MPNDMLQGRRVLVTQADDFMGPMLCEVFAAHGADVIASTQPLLDAAAPAALIAATGTVDVLVVNLALPAPTPRRQTCPTANGAILRRHRRAAAAAGAGGAAADGERGVPAASW